MVKKRGILVVSFGTCHEETRRLTIEAIKNVIQSAYPDIPVYEAWTSKVIIARIQKMTGEKIRTVEEALGAMKEDGITDVYIQPTHVINGFENDQMREEALSYREDFEHMAFGRPLISNEEDMQEIIQVICGHYAGLKQEEALILMGHGTRHHINAVYGELDHMFGAVKEQKIHMCTVEEGREPEEVLEILRQQEVKKIYLVPFMIVAGNHAINDMAGESEDSWYNRCKNAGFEVSCCMKGLGEYPEVQDMFCRHLEDAMKNAAVS